MDLDIAFNLLAATVRSNKTQRLPTLDSLEDRCFHYIIHHLSEFPPGSLCLLPVTIRKKLLLNLPAVDIWRLEADGITEGLDEESLWNSLIDERCQDVSRKHFRQPFFHRMSSRDVYFAFVWDHVFQQPSLFDNTLSKLLYNVPCVFGVDGLTISEYNYQQSKYKLKHVIQNDPDVRAVFLHSNLIPKREFIATIRYFGEVCRIRPKHICFHCMSVGKRIWILAMEQSSSILQSFMANLEVVRFDGRGPLAHLEKFHRETQHERFKRLFLCIPKLFLGAAIANPQCSLRSIEVDAGDSQRAAGLLASIQSVLSAGYSKVEDFSVKFHHVYSRGNHQYPDHSLTFCVLSDTTQLINAQLQLRSVDVSFPEKIPSTGDNVELRLSQERYTEFVTTIEKYMQRLHFECLTLRNVLTFETTQQIIRIFLSLPLSPNIQLLDIRRPDDITSASDPIIEGQGKSLMVSGGTTSDEYLTQVVFQMLCNTSVHNFEVVDNINGIVSALKQSTESLQVKSLCLTIRKVSHDQMNEAHIPPRSQYRRGGRGGRRLPAYQRRLFQDFGMEIPHQGYHLNSDRNQYKDALSNVPQAIEFPEIPMVDKLIGNPSLLALRIRFQSAEDYLASSQVSSFLSTISNGLQLQSCNLRSLTLPKLDHPLGNGDELKPFFRCIFSLPHVEELHLNLTFVVFSLQCAEIIRSCHCESGKMLAKLSLHCDSVTGSDQESLRVLLNDSCRDLVL